MCLPDTSRPHRAGLSTQIHSIVHLRETFYKTAKKKKQRKKNRNKSRETAVKVMTAQMGRFIGNLHNGSVSG